MGKMPWVNWCMLGYMEMQWIKWCMLGYMEMQWIKWCMLGYMEMQLIKWCMLGYVEHAMNQLDELFAVMNWSVLEHAEAVMDCCMLGYVEAVMDFCMQGDVGIATGVAVWSLRWPCEDLRAVHETPGGTSRHYPKTHVLPTWGTWIHEVSSYSPTQVKKLINVKWFRLSFSIYEQTGEEIKCV